MADETVPGRFRDRLSRRFRRSPSHPSSGQTQPSQSNTPSQPEVSPKINSQLLPLSSSTHSDDRAPTALQTEKIAGSSGLDTTSAVALGQSLLERALELLPEDEKSIITKHILSTGDGISSALQHAHDAAETKQKLCEERRWNFNFNGHMVMLRDEASRVTMWLDKFKLIGNFAANIDPIHFGLPWAGVRIVLEAAVSESNRMAALLIGVKTSLYMMKRLEVYLDYLEDLSASIARIHFESSLIEFHALILRFLARAIQTYEKSMLTRAIDSFWKPNEICDFESECDKIGARVEVEASNCDRTIARSDIKQRKEYFDKVLEELKDLHDMKQSIDVISRKIDIAKLPYAEGAAFDSHEDKYEVTCLKGTRTDILRQITEWAKDEKSKCIYWLKGMAGTGKSTICRTVARYFQENRRLGASFFFKRGEGDRANAKQLFTTLAAQLAINVPELAPYIAQAIDADPSLPSKILQEQFEKLILEPLSYISSVTDQPQTLIIAIDALDECEDEHDIRTILRLLAKAEDVKPVSLRIFVTSRPELPVRLGFSDMSGVEFQDFVLHEIPKATIEHNISIYLKHEFKKIGVDYSKRQCRHSLPADWPGDQIMQTLIDLAVPLFIFAATLCRFIADPRWDPQKRLNAILELQTASQTSKLDKTYAPVLNQLFIDQDESEKDRLAEEFREVVGAIITVANHLSAISLAKLLDIPREDVDIWLDFLHSVLNIPLDEDVPIRLLHLSFRDFLIDPLKEGNSPFWINEREIHKRLASKSIQLLSQPGGLRENVCQLPSPGTLCADIDRQTVDTFLPAEIQYACRYWAYHLKQSMQYICDEDEVHIFLKEHLLHWLEALSLIGHSSESTIMIRTLRTITVVNSTDFEVLLSSPGNQTQSKSKNTIFDFITDVERFILYNRHIIEYAPLQVYSSALVFAPDKSLVRQQFRQQLPTWTKRHPRDRGNWTSAIQALEGHSDIVSFVAFSPKGEQLASASWDKTIRLWDLATCTTTWILKGHDAGILSAVFSPDGEQLASASDDKVIRLWNTTTGAALQTLEDEGYSLSILFSPNGKQLASVSKNNTIRLWDTGLGTLLQAFEGNSLEITSAEFSTDGQQLAWASEDDDIIRLRDIVTGTVLQNYEGHSNWVRSIAFSPDSKQLASASYENTVWLWDAKTGAMKHLLEENSGTITSVVFSPSGKQLASAVATRRMIIRLWDTATGTMLQTFAGHSDWIGSIAFSPNRKQLASASADKTVRLWNIAIKDTIQTLNGNNTDVVSVLFSPNGKQLAFEFDDKTMQLWDTVTGDTLQIFEGHSGVFGCIAFSPDGKQLASTLGDETIRLLDTATGARVQTLKGHSNRVSSLAFLANGKQLASASHDGTIRLWDLDTGAIVQTLKGHSDWIISISVSSNGKQLVSVSHDETFRLWDIATGTELQRLDTYGDSISYIAISPDGRYLASVSWHKTIRLWDVVEGVILQTFHVKTPIRRMSFSEDGRNIETNLGQLSIQGSFPDSLKPKAQIPGDIFIEGDWITRNGERLLWLPSEYRESCLDVFQNLVVVGDQSDQITFIDFN